MGTRITIFPIPRHQRPPPQPPTCILFHRPRPYPTEINHDTLLGFPLHKMAKSSRSSTTKANNQRLKAKVFGPVESARQQRLSAKLLELASQPKPVPEKEMKDAEEQGEAEDKAGQESKADDSKCLDSCKDAPFAKQTTD